MPVSSMPNNKAANHIRSSMDSVSNFMPHLPLADRAQAFFTISSNIRSADGKRLIARQNE